MHDSAVACLAPSCIHMQSVTKICSSLVHLHEGSTYDALVREQLHEVKYSHHLLRSAPAR